LTETAAGGAGRRRSVSRWNERTLAGVLLFLALATSYGYFAPDGGANVNSRLSLVFAVLDEGRLNIDSYHDAPLTETGDKSFHQGHYYSDKAIGTSVLGIVAYAPVSMRRAVSSAWRYVVTRHWITFLSVGLPVAAALTYLFLVLDSLALGRRDALRTALIGGLATPLWPFATLYFGHALVAASLIASFLMVMHRRHAQRPWTRLARVLLGGLLGFSMITEFPVAPAALTIASYYLFAARERRELALVQTWLLPVLGALPFVSLQLAYNAICFGSPFSLGYGHIADPDFRAVHAQGLLGVRLPSLEVLYYITLHPVRGILFHSPVLGCGLGGLLLGIWQQRWRAEAITCLAVAAFVLLVNAGYGVWWGGFVFTARHSIPAIPFLLVGLAFLPRRVWPIVAVLGVVSAAQMLVAVAGDPLTPDEELIRLAKSSGTSVAALGSPLWSHIWPALLADPRNFSPNLGRVLGLAGFASLIPYCLAIAVLLLAYGLLSRTRRTTAQ
jgi:hypothetical protein